jgi:shikimate dehydrogenase
VIGGAIDYTLSPAIQNAALDHFGMNYRYVALSCGAGDLPAMVGAVRLLGMPGANVTIPHKEAVAPLLDGCSAIARRVGAVNTIVNRGGRLTGENTDCRGFDELLRLAGARRVKSALVLGAGGAARAVIAVLLDRGVERIELACRRAGPGRAVLRALGADGAGKIVPWERRNEAEAEVVVNATPLGQKRRDPLPVARAVVRRARAVVDLVVRPPETRLVAVAREEGVAAREGSAMLIAQGRESFRLWFGRRAPAAVMEEALRRAG